MSDFDSPVGKSRRQQQGILGRLWWFALIIVTLTLLGALISSLAGTSETGTTGMLPTTVESYEENELQLTRCADPANDCGRYDPRQRPTSTSVPVGTPVSQANGQPDGSLPQNTPPIADTATPIAAFTQTPIPPPPTIAPDIAATLDSLFVPQPVPPAADGLSLDDRAFFDRAIDNTLNATSFRYDANVALVLNIPGQQGTVNLQVAGVAQNWQHLGEPGFALSARFTASANLDGTPQSETIEARIIGDALYIEMPAEDGQRIWVETAFSDLSNIGFSGESINEMYADMGMNLSQFDEVPQILDLFAFDSFVTTERLGNQGDTAYFHTAFDLPGFLRSELLDSLIFSLASFSGLDTSDSAITNDLRLQIRTFQATLDSTLPQLDLNIDRYVSLTNEYLTRIVADFGTRLAGVDAIGQTAEVGSQVDLSLNLSGYDQGLTVDAPPNAVRITPEQIEQLMAQTQVTVTQPE